MSDRRLKSSSNYATEKLISRIDEQFKGLEDSKTNSKEMGKGHEQAFF